MKNRNEQGFSLIELLVVCVIIGIVAALAVPALQKATRAAENGSTYGSMRAIASLQANFYAQNGRFARITELNTITGGKFGTTVGNDVNRGKFVISMVPANPTDAELRDTYTMNAVRNVSGEGVTYTYELTHTGAIKQISPLCSEGFCS